jgi:hypothetical protein
MKWFSRLCLIAAVALPCAAALAQDLPTGVKISGQYQSYGYCQITSLAAAVALPTALNTAGCNPIPSANCSSAAQCPVFAEICNEGTAARYRDDGTAPTASIGMIVPSGTATAPSCFQYAGPLAALQLISESSGSVIDLTFYR